MPMDIKADRSSAAEKHTITKDKKKKDMKCMINL